MSYCIASVLVLVCCVHFSFSKNVNILVVSPSLTRGNQVWNHAIVLGLANKGHYVTVITPFLPEMIKSNNEKITYIILEGAMEKFKPPKRKPYLYDYDMPDINDMKQVAKNNWDKARLICDFYLNTQGLQTILDYSSDIKFAVILWDLENSECLYPLVAKLGNPPIIALSPSGFQPMLDWIFGTHWKPYLPLPGLPYDKDMNIMRRFMNAVTIKFMHYQKYEVYLKENVNSAKKIFKDFNLQDALNLEKIFLLTLVNSNFDMDYARDVLPNFILVGGLHIDICHNLQNLENDTTLTEEIIYVSLQDEKFDLKQLQGIADCLGSLKEFKIYWRVNDLTGKIIKPKNIVFNDTFNQIQVLGNKNTKLFITSGNLLSLQEALYFGVPLLAIPSTYAQANYVKKLPIATGAQVAIKEKYLCQKIREILNDDDYLENTRRNSERFTDKPIRPLDRAIYWVEYVVRHGGAKDLETGVRRMSYYESENIDLLFFAFVLLVLFPLGSLYLLMKCVRRKSMKYVGRIAVKVKRDKIK